MIEPTAPTSAAERQCYVDAGHWSASETIPALLAANARKHPDRDAVVDDHGRRLTYAELDALSSRMADALLARGIESGDVVGVQMANRCDSVVVVHGVLKMGGVVNSLVPMYRDRELEHMCSTCRTTALIVPGTYRGFDHEAMTLRVAAAVPSLKLLVSMGDADTDGVESLSELLAEGDEHRPPASLAADPDAPAAVLFTSGTEALPKGAIHSHNTLLANARALNTILDMDERDGVFMASPLAHATGFGFGILLACYLGSTLALLDIWDAEAAARMMAAERSAYTHAATPFALDLLGVPGIRDRHDLSGLRYFVSGGASVPGEVVERIETGLGCLLLRLYGQTEAFMTAVNRPQDGQEVRKSRDGRPAPGVEFRLCDDADRPVASGVSGRAACRGPHLCLGFVDDAEQTRAAFTSDGFMWTGDLCTVDEHGYMTVDGRKKEVISRGGYKFSPREIEDLLHLHPAIQRVAVVRVPDQRLGERACAVVVPTPGTDIELSEIVGFLREEGVAPYKWPERLEVVAELPMTASGKVQKFVLEKRLRDELDDDAPTAGINATA